MSVFLCNVHDRWQSCRLLPTAYVVRREGYVLTRRLSSCLSTPGGGGTPARSSRGVPPPHQTWPGRVPRQGGTPPRVTPHPPVGPGRGVPHLGRTWYAAVGMPLAFRQEDFLVSCCFRFKLLFKSWLLYYIITAFHKTLIVHEQSMITDSKQKRNLLDYFLPFEACSTQNMVFRIFDND